MSWDRALHFCKLRNANLLSIQSAEEMDALSNYLIANVGQKRFWTSGHYLEEEKEWRFLGSGSKAKYMRWGPGEPNRILATEDCVEIDGRRGTYLLNDLTCIRELLAICEK